ncbi:YqaA family protein [Kocuria gwangalliensis]|uniref:YqaA family protein n=1 Tax=Kocuria gwangalliensis TaxID=501592 RepID=UPI0031EC6C8C
MSRSTDCRDHAVAAAWGFAEATAFFIVPDVWLSAVAMKSPKRGLTCVASATAGAVLGGALTHTWGATTGAARSARLLTKLPAVSAAMVRRVENDYATKGYRALLTGPLRGTPYKIYARTNGLLNRSLPRFLLWSVPARAPRFILVTAVMGGLGALGEKLLPNAPEWVRWSAFAAGWLGFYTWFFKTVGR